MKQFLSILLFTISTFSFAYTPSEQAKISILTCSSGKEVYKIYGHTALRFSDPEQRKDIVYNYGMFDFDTPHFIIRYLQGQNVYLLGRESFKRFQARYLHGGEKLTEQVLNLDYNEVVQLFNALEENAKPENRDYLYNVFYDNCATRAYRIIEDNIDGGIVWNSECEDLSFRDLMHAHNNIMPFSQMGIDIVFGLKADKVVTCREQMFLPEKLKIASDQATIHNNRSLISTKETLLEGRDIHTNTERIIFHSIFTCLLLIILFVRFKKPKHIRTTRAILYTTLGLFSLVVFFIAFCSIHPTVLPNLNLIWINPLWLFFSALFIFNKKPKVIFQKLLNGWSIIIATYLILGLAGVFYMHYGLIYILTAIVVISYKRIRLHE